MSFLLNLIPAPYRILALCLLAAALVGFGFVKGLEVGERRLDKAEAKALKEGARIAKAREIVTHTVEIKWLPQITREHVITETITKEVAVYVPSTDPDLGAGWRELHDAAAAGRLPDPSRIGNGEPVPAQAAAQTVAENYGSCRADQAKLSELQEWIREQQKVK